MVELSGFSDWVLALLPRLFLYPGGLWMLAGLLALRFASKADTERGTTALLYDLSTSNLLALSTGWVGVALLPLPGATPLPLQPDRLIMVALPLMSILFDKDLGRMSIIAGASVTTALMVPVAATHSLYPAGDWTPTNVLSLLAVGLALIAISRRAARKLSGATRWLAWCGLAATPLWIQANAPLSDFLWVSLIYGVAIGLVIVATRFFGTRLPVRLLLAASCALTAASLFVALLN